MPEPTDSSVVQKTSPICARVRGVYPATLVILSLVTACWFFNRWTWRDLCVPVNYAIDSIGAMANCQAFAEGATPWRADVTRLNAPFTANWNDNPITETLVYLTYSVAMRILPLGAAQNSMVWLALISAVLGGYAAARWSGSSRFPSATAGLLFGFSHFLTYRASGHLSLAFAWHIPLILAFVHRLFMPRAITRNTWLAALALALTTAVQNPYYGFFFAYLMGISAMIMTVRREWHRAMLTLVAAATWAAGFMLNLAGYWRNQQELGPNPDALTRSLLDLEMWALRLSDLIWPVAHPIAAWNRLAASSYFGAGIPVDEHSSNFLGLAGLIALAVLLVHTGWQMISGRIKTVSTEAWCALFALAYGVQGGLNLVFGSAGFVMLRATNRYSVIVLCAALLFFARAISTKVRPSVAAIFCMMLLALQGWELHSSPRRMIGLTMEQHRMTMASDQDFGTRLEASLPHGAMVFQLPVWDYPEGGRRHAMRDYDHFRPYLWTDHLRFSYGSCKGRVREAWQRDVETLPVPDMMVRLASYGFSVLFINREAYADRAAQLEAALIAAGYQPLVESIDHQFITYRINPDPSPITPRAEPALSYGSGFYSPHLGLGVPWNRLTSGNAHLMLQRGDAGTTPIEMNMLLHASRRQTITLASGPTVWWSGVVEPDSPVPVRWVMEPDQPVTALALTTDTTPQPARETGGFITGFSVELPSCRPATNDVELGHGFYAWEMWADGHAIAWAWLASGAELLIAPATNPALRQLTMTIGAPVAMQAEITRNGLTVWRGSMAGGERTPITLEIPYDTATTRLSFTTDLTPRHLSTNDNRSIAFAITEVQLSPAR